MMDGAPHIEQEAGGNAGSTSPTSELPIRSTPAPAKPDEFDWYEDPNIVQFELPSVAVYTNTVDNIVIRQRQNWDEDDDTFIFLAPANARKVANAILRAADLTDTVPAPKQPRATERTRAALAQPDLLQDRGD